ncbi:hypothetical protein VNO77_32970 [Canavalia gladiata]|uniref:Uncharacterized protein n=1 Tax=Canavalia gladiata TaxID=3824 RepID=A0AAN9KCY4_CANGL
MLVEVEMTTYCIYIQSLYSILPVPILHQNGIHGDWIGFLYCNTPCLLLAYACLFIYLLLCQLQLDRKTMVQHFLELSTFYFCLEYEMEETSLLGSNCEGNHFDTIVARSLKDCVTVKGKHQSVRRSLPQAAGLGCSITNT